MSGAVIVPESVPGVVELETYSSNSSRWLLIEVPHGATRKSDYDAVVSQLKSALPERLEHFFFVNTDIGAPEGAASIGNALSTRGINVLVARCLIPRTFIDTNRVIANTVQGEVKDGLTSALPGYIDASKDGAWLTAQHARYHQIIGALYTQVCKDARGLALQLHSYSPRSVNIEKTDGGIVAALHAAYVPEVYAQWPERPPVDLISATADGSFRTAPKLVAKLLLEYQADGIAAQENATYHLHPATMGLVYAQAHPEQVVCVEMNRGLLADPFVPFGVSPISGAKVARMVAPIERVLQAWQISAG